MPIPLPDLDDRRWTDLVDEGRALIPLFSPVWTDHNLHDPGITILELLAGETELDLYRVNRVPPSHVRKFLALVGVEPRPPRAARTVLAFRLASGLPPRVLPAGLEVETEDVAGVRTVFRTLEPVTVVGLRLEAVQTGGPGGFVDLTARRRRGEVLALFGDDPAPGAAAYFGFDRPLPVGVPVSFAFSLQPGGGEGARTAWEIQVRPGVWRRLDPDAGEVVDETRSLTAGGRVLFTVPAAMAAGRVGPVEASLFYLRCRLARGAWDAPPAALRTAVHGAAAEQAETVAERAIGRGNGEPHQRLELPRTAVQGGTLELATREAAGRLVWTERPDFDLSGRADAHFLLDATAGRVTFGDGENGRRLPPGVTASAAYRATRGAEGNLPAGRIFRALPDGVEVDNPVPAEGGAAAETLEEAASRAVDSVEQPLRAVTLADYERIALETPGVRLARAVARANFDPAFPCFRATGVITVIAVPFLPRRRPVPTPATRRAVRRHLADRRLIGTRLIVIGPVYLEVAVRATVRSLPGTDPAELRQRIVAALDRFLHPLTGGPDGTGWTLGRDVYRSEVLQVLDETPGVDHVLSLELVARGAPSCGNVCVEPTVLVVAGEHAVDVAGRPS